MASWKLEINYKKNVDTSAVFLVINIKQAKN